MISIIVKGAIILSVVIVIFILGDAFANLRIYKPSWGAEIKRHAIDVISSKNPRRVIFEERGVLEMMNTSFFSTDHLRCVDLIPRQDFFSLTYGSSFAYCEDDKTNSSSLILF